MLRFDWGNIFVTTEISVTEELNNNVKRTSLIRGLDPWDAKANSWQVRTIQMVSLNKEDHIEEDEEAVLGPLPDFKSKDMDRVTGRESLYAATV